MKYIGGKTKIADWVVDNSIRFTFGKQKTTYVEPFVGSAAVFVKMAPHFSTSIAADGHPDLILMWKALAEGWEPPREITKDMIEYYRDEKPSPMRGYVGFIGCFRGVFFGGHVGGATESKSDMLRIVEEGRRSVLKRAKVLRSARIFNRDFEKLEADSDMVIYCDPPYKGTVGYKGNEVFDHERFWDVAEKWHEQGAVVIVSEEWAPYRWNVLASLRRINSLGNSRGGEGRVRIEQLFVHR